MFAMRPAGVSARHQRFDFRDRASVSLQSQSKDGRCFIFADGAEETDLSRAQIVYVKRVGSPRTHGVPESVTQLKLLAVFSEGRVLRQRQPRWIVCDKGREVFIHKMVQAGAIA